MGRYCLVPGCKSGDPRFDHVRVHLVPKDQKIFDKWIQQCKRSDKFNPKNTGVCALHFVESDYERDLQFEMLNPTKDPADNKHRKLKIDAVPSQNLPSRKMER